VQQWRSLASSGHDRTPRQIRGCVIGSITLGGKWLSPYVAICRACSKLALGRRRKKLRTYIHGHLRHVAVNAWALDEWHNRIYYGVEDEAGALALDRRLAALNVPCFLVVREVVGQIRVN
jgi:hypothetical protein